MTTPDADLLREVDELLSAVPCNEHGVMSNWDAVAVRVLKLALPFLSHAMPVPDWRPVQRCHAMIYGGDWRCGNLSREEFCYRHRAAPKEKP